MDGELREIQTSLSAEIATLKGKIEQTERAAKDLSYSNGDGRNQKQIDTFGEEIQALQKRLEFLGKKSAAIFDERKAFNLWLPAAKRVQGRLFDALGFEHYDLFPTLSPYSRKLPAGEVIG